MPQPALAAFPRKSSGRARTPRRHARRAAAGFARFISRTVYLGQFQVFGESEAGTQQNLEGESFLCDSGRKRKEICLIPVESV